MNTGWVKLWRKTMFSGMNIPLLGFWAYCLMQAAGKPQTRFVGNQQVSLEPGQFVFGRKAWAAALGVSEKQVRNWIKSVSERGQIRAVCRASKYTVFSIVNWDIYQGGNEELGQQPGQQPGQEKGREGARKGPHKKNVEKEENNTQSSSEDCVPPSAALPPKKRPKTATAIPDEFPLTDEMIAFARQQGCNGNIQAVTEAFLDYHRAKGSRFKDWPAAWRTWIRNEVKFRKPGPPVSRKTQHNLTVIQDFLSRGEQ